MSARGEFDEPFAIVKSVDVAGHRFDGDAGSCRRREDLKEGQSFSRCLDGECTAFSTEDNAHDGFDWRGGKASIELGFSEQSSALVLLVVLKVRIH